MVASRYRDKESLLIPDANCLLAELLALAVENGELRLQLAKTQDQCVELAVDAGDLHAEIEALRARLVTAEGDRDAWRAETDRLAAELDPRRREATSRN